MMHLSGGVDNADPVQLYGDRRASRVHPIALVLPPPHHRGTSGCDPKPGNLTMSETEHPSGRPNSHHGSQYLVQLLAHTPEDGTDSDAPARLSALPNSTAVFRRRLPI